MSESIKIKLEYFQVPNEIFDSNIEIEVDEKKKVKGSNEIVKVTRPLKTYEKLIYIYLCRCGNNGGQAFPSYNAIAKKCGIGRRTTIEGVANLIKNGLLEKRSRKKIESLDDGFKDSSNEYLILKPNTCLASAPSASPSASGAPTPVRSAHPPSAPGAPKKEPYKKNHIKKEIYKDGDNFLKWYSLYPNPWNKEQSFKNFEKLMKKETYENLMTATKNYIAYLEHKGCTDKNYIVRSTNFIGQKKEYLGYLEINLETLEKKESKKAIDEWK